MMQPIPSPTILDDAAIVELYLRRDETAIGYTCAKYGLRLRALAENLLDDPGAAEECENDVYWKAWNAIPPHEPYAYLFAFLAKLTRRLALDMCRARGRYKRSAPLVELTAELEQCIPGQEDVQAQLEAAEWGRRLTAFLRGLPPTERTVFLRRYWYMETVTAIARNTGFSQSKIKSMLLRTRKKLRRWLEEETSR